MNKTNKNPLYILAAVPNNGINFKRFLDGGEDSPKNLLEKPPYLRYGGWNMLTLDQARIREGSYWELKNGERKTIQLYRDGSFISIARADNSFLGWGISKDNFLAEPGLNPLAIIEYTYEFVELFRKLLNFMESVRDVNFRVELVNTELVNGKRLILNPHLPSNPFWQPSEGREIEKDFIHSMQIPLEKNTYSSKYIAFLLIQEVFLRFGILPENILYHGKDDQGKLYIDIKKFPK